MLDIYDELKYLIKKLEENGIEYALCGGLAMAVHGIPRSTVDIDLLVQKTSLERIKGKARELGYTLEATPMNFANGAVEIHRISKIDPDSRDILMVDILMVTPSLLKVWEAREKLEWEGSPLFVVSREGLIFLKSMRNSGQDMDDIKRLKGDAQ